MSKQYTPTAFDINGKKVNNPETHTGKLHYSCDAVCKRCGRVMSTGSVNSAGYCQNCWVTRGG